VQSAGASHGIISNIMRIGLTYDLQTDPADERQAEFDPPSTIGALCDALEALGHEVLLLGNAHDLLRDPRRLGEADLVFNLAEGTHGRCREAWVPTLLELHGAPYVGSDPVALMLGLDKAMAKRIAQAEGVPTPRWVTLVHPSALPRDISLNVPVIVKPRDEGSGRGLDAGAIVSRHEQLTQRVRWLFERCPAPMLIEEFIPYGELTVCVIGNDPPTAYPAIQRPLDAATRLSCHLVKPAPARTECPLVLDEALDAAARQIALTMFQAIGCRDLARVDLRVDDARRLYFLEINPLPSWDPQGTMGLLAEYLGVRYADLIGRVLEAARSRLGHPHTVASAR